MASSLGTLTLDLIAKIGGFTGPLDKAGLSAQKLAKTASEAGTIIGASIAGGLTLATAALTAWTAKQLDVISDQDDLAHRLRTSVEGLGTITRAAQLSGVSLESLTKGAEKLDVALGQAAAGGEAQRNAFERLGLSYKAVAALPIDERISAINQALEANVPAYERASVAATLFGAKNAAAFQQLDPDTIAEANRQITVLGVKLSDIDSSKVENAGDAVSIFSLALDGVQKQLTVYISPLLTQVSKDFFNAAENAGGLGTAVKTAGDDVVSSLAFIVDAGDGVVRVFDIAANTVVGLYATAAGRLAQLAASSTDFLSHLPGATGAEFAAQSAGYRQTFETNMSVAAQAAAKIKSDLESPLAGTKLKDYFKDAQEAAQKAAEAATSGADDETKHYKITGEQFAEMLKARKAAQAQADADAKKLAQTFKSTEEDYERQIELINTSADKRQNATEVAKLSFEIESGKLVGINQQQQARLNLLATELDRLEKLKTANEDAAKAAAFNIGLKDTNQTVREGFDLEITGSGSGDKLKDRLKQDLAIRLDYAKQQQSLDKQYAKDGNKDLYDTETENLEEALAERVVIQQDYYNQLDAQQSNWLDGVSAAWQNYADTATNFQKQASDATAGILTDTTSVVADNIDQLLKGTESVGDATKNVVLGIASSVIKAIEQMAAQWLVYQAVQLITGKTTQASAATTLIANAQATAFQASLAAFASTAAIPIVGPILAPAAAASAAAFAAPFVAGVATSALAGMAHDGIDSVPADGSWFLQKGERVTTAETSAKLDKTLDDVRGNRGQGGTTVNMIEDASKAGQTRTRLDADGIQEVIDVWVAKLYSDDDVMQAITHKTGVQAVGR